MPLKLGLNAGQAMRLELNDVGSEAMAMNSKEEKEEKEGNGGHGRCAEHQRVDSSGHLKELLQRAG